MSARMRLTNIMSKMRRKPQKPALREAAKHKKWDIVRGDKVQVIGNHPESGKQGTVIQVIRKQDRLIVEGVNMGTKHIKGNPDKGIEAKVIQKERAIHYSKVNLVDPIKGEPTRIYKKILEDGTKVRVAKKSGAVIPRPEILKHRKKPISSLVTESDTTEEHVWEITYKPMMES